MHINILIHSSQINQQWLNRNNINSTNPITNHKNEQKRKKYE